MDQKTSLKNPDEILKNNMIIEINDNFCHTKEDNMSKQDIPNNYATQY